MLVVWSSPKKLCFMLQVLWDHAATTWKTDQQHRCLLHTSPSSAERIFQTHCTGCWEASCLRKLHCSSAGKVRQEGNWRLPTSKTSMTFYLVNISLQCLRFFWWLVGITIAWSLHGTAMFAVFVTVHRNTVRLLTPTSWGVLKRSTVFVSQYQSTLLH